MLTDTPPKSEIDEIIRQLQDIIRQHEPERRGLPPESALRNATTVCPELIDRIQACGQVNPHLPIAWPSWPKGIGPKIVALAQKAVRRTLRWYINPIVAQQNAHNAAVNQLLVRLYEVSLQQARQLASLQLEVETLRSPAAVQADSAATSVSAAVQTGE